MELHKYTVMLLQWYDVFCKHKKNVSCVSVNSKQTQLHCISAYSEKKMQKRS